MTDRDTTPVFDPDDNDGIGFVVDENALEVSDDGR